MKGADMGKQINYYASSETFKMLLNFWFKNGLQIVIQDPRSKAIIIESSIKSELFRSPFYVYDSNLGKIVLNNLTGLINDGATAILQVNPTIIDDKKMTIRRGRVWVSTAYWNDAGEKCVADSQLIKHYNKTVKFIKKIMPYRTICKGENNEFSSKSYISDELLELVQYGEYKFC